MSYNWCHGPKCHTNHTVDRIRGTKGNKVLRTRKITENNWNRNTVWSHFCSQGCWLDFMNKHWSSAIALGPRTEPLETPIDDPKKVEHEGWGGHKWTSTEITKKQVDSPNTNNVG